MESLETFCWAAAGFVMGEAVACYISLRQNGWQPDCWRLPLYWAVVAILALCAGGFAVALEIETKKQALFAGLACPYVIQRFLSAQIVPSHRTRGRK
jgi:uncharacterized membrane protein